jgi:hypothetical protein
VLNHSLSPGKIPCICLTYCSCTLLTGKSAGLRNHFKVRRETEAAINANSTPQGPFCSLSLNFRDLGGFYQHQHPQLPGTPWWVLQFLKAWLSAITILTYKDWKHRKSVAVLYQLIVRIQNPNRMTPRKQLTLNYVLDILWDINVNKMLLSPLGDIT